MSRMIPPIISKEERLKSKAEGDFFDWFSRMEWGNAIVMHSLGLKEHITKSFGEIDFLIICEMGVMCVEVKGGLVELKDGLWGFTPVHSKSESPKTTWKTEGPYKQVQGNMKSIKQYLEKILPENDSIMNCRWACCVMTPDCVIASDDKAEVIPQITFDINMREEDLPEYFTRCFKYWSEEKHYGGKDDLKKKDRERLSTLIRGDFSMIPPLSAIINRSEDQLLAITDEQLEIIGDMFDNDRMLVKGGAGTGKTLLAAEQCRRFSSVGEKVLYLCFNNLISEYVKCVFENDPSTENVDVYTFHELLMKVSNKTDVPKDNQENFFDSILPAAFMNEMKKEVNQKWAYDRVIIDEGQDLLKENAYYCIDEIIKNGWQAGKWTLYYDANQNIYGSHHEFNEILEILKQCAFTYPLTVNCRNTKQICSCNKAITLLPQPKYMRAEGEEVNYVPYKSKNDEANLLFESIRRIRSGGVLKKDIVILSGYRMDNPHSCLYQRSIPDDIGKIKVNVTAFNDNKAIRFYTIQSFKGLESKVVILIDVDNFSDDDKVMQNYVGISRARSYLEILYDSKLNQERQERLMKSILSK